MNAALRKFEEPAIPVDPNEITAVIKNARFINVGDNNVVGGQIYDDVRGRWPDGTTIYTSNVLDVQDDIVVTRNSRYRIERKG